MKYHMLLTTALIVFGAATLSAQQPMTHHAKAPGPRKVELKESQPGLTSQATVSLGDALKTAQGVVPGTVTSERLEKRRDQVVYRFGIRSNGRVRHVMIDAKSNTVVKPQARVGKLHQKPRPSVRKG